MFVFLIEQCISYEENDSATLLDVLVNLEKGDLDLSVMNSANFETPAALNKSPSFLVL